MEADYSQLEQAWLAVVSGDKQLVEDLNNGIDFHSLTVSYLLDMDYEIVYNKVKAGDEEFTAHRKKAKSMRFAANYGAGANTIAKRAGISLELAKKFLEMERERFKGVTAWQHKVKAEVERSKEAVVFKNEETGEDEHKLRGRYMSPSGRIYTFYGKEAPEWMQEKGTYVTFSPTEIKNYPVQGGATGDVVPLMVGKLYRRLRAAKHLRENVLLIGTVHDSVVLDVNAAQVDVRRIARSVKHCLDQVREEVWKAWKLYVGVNVVSEVTWGESWGAQTEKL